MGNSAKSVWNKNLINKQLLKILQFHFDARISNLPAAAQLIKIDSFFHKQTGFKNIQSKFGIAKTMVDFYRMP